MPNSFFHHRRPGVTFVEVLLFVAILSMVAGLVMPLLFNATENRLLQETIGIVEGNGVQILQKIGQEVRQAERILDPAPNITKSVLLLQTASGTTNPTMFGVSSGILLMVHRNEKQTISSSQVAVEDFHIRNTSASDSRQSVYVTFKLIRTIRLSAPHFYTKNFEALITLYPTDILRGGECNDIAPACEGLGIYAWRVCDSPACSSCPTQRISVVCQ